MGWLGILNDAVKAGFFAKGIVDEFKSSQKLQTIIDKYELDYCDSADEVRRKLERLSTESPDDCTLFNKEYPDLHKYLKHAQANPGTPFPG